MGKPTLQKLRHPDIKRLLGTLRAAAKFKKNLAEVPDEFVSND
jgi:hypothetical protein